MCNFFLSLHSDDIMGEYQKRQVVGVIYTDEKGQEQIYVKVFRGMTPKDDAIEKYHQMVSLGLTCFRAEIVASHGEG